MVLHPFSLLYIPRFYDSRSITGRGFQIVLSRSSAEEVSPFISALEVLRIRMAHVRVVRIRKTSNAKMKRKTSSTKLLDKKTLESPPRDWPSVLSRAIKELGGSFLLVLGPTFSALLTNESLLTNAVGNNGYV
jgi:hypothetical protein